MDPVKEEMQGDSDSIVRKEPTQPIVNKKPKRGKGRKKSIIDSRVNVEQETV